MLILLADDEDSLRDIITNALEILGDHEVLHAADGQACLEMLESHHPDLLLLDMSMPVMDGMSVLRRLYGSPKRPPRVIAMSAFSGTGAGRAELEELGVTATLKKPFVLSDLLEAMTALEA